MVGAAGVPVAKLFLLAVRQVSKPIANRIKSAAKTSDNFRAASVGLGRWLYRTQIQLARVAEGKHSLAHVSQLNEDKATERAAEFVSEAVIYSVAGSTVVYEWRQQQAEKARKERQAEVAEQKRIEAALENARRQWDEFGALARRITQLDEQMRQLYESHARAEERAKRRGWFGGPS